MALPNVKINLGNGNLGRISLSSDSVAGLILTGVAIAGKLELNKRYQLSGTRDLENLGVTTENNPLVDKDVKAFYAAAGEGAELHLLVVSQATTMTQMCATEFDSPMSKLIDAAGGRIRIVGINKKPADGYQMALSEGIDPDAKTAISAAQSTAVSYAQKMYPFRILMGALVDITADELYKPVEGSYNRVGVVIGMDRDTPAVGMVLGRAAAIEPQQSIARVKDGAIAPEGFFYGGSSHLEKAGFAESLHDAGYIFFRGFAAKNGCYLNSDRMAAPISDDYSRLALGRVIDKATIIAYTTFISEIQDNVYVSADGGLTVGACRNYEAMIENAVAVAMNGQISDFKAYVDPKQNILSSETLSISCRITPVGVISTINVNLEFQNPALKK